MPRTTRYLFPMIVALILVVSSGCSTPPSNVSLSTGDSLGPTLAIDSQGDLHMAWFDNSQGAFDIYYATKPKSDKWASPLNVSNTPGYSRAPSIAVDGQDNVHLVWYDRSPGNEDIFYSVKPRGGPWSQPVNLTQSPNDSSFPFLFADRNDDLHIVFYETSAEGEDIFHMGKASGGQWSEPQNVSNNPGNSRNPVIAADGAGALHVAWDDNASAVSEVFWATKPAGGEWSKAVDVSRTSGNSEFPRLATDAKGALHLVWYDNSRGAWDIYYTSKSANQDWAQPTNVTSGNNGDSGFPRLAVDAEGVRLVWNYRPAGDTTTYTILYAVKRAGVAWTKPSDVSKSKADAGDPDIVLDRDGRAHIVWSDKSPGNWEVIYTSQDK